MPLRWAAMQLGGGGGGGGVLAGGMLPPPPHETLRELGRLLLQDGSPPPWERGSGGGGGGARPSSSSSSSLVVHRAKDAADAWLSVQPRVADTLARVALEHADGATAEDQVVRALGHALLQLASAATVVSGGPPAAHGLNIR
jgi:hypothetical protein